MKLNCFLCCEAFPCVASSVLFSELLSECPPKMHARTHTLAIPYPHLHTSDVEKWNLQLEFDCGGYSLHTGSQVSGLLSSRVKPCRLAQTLESLGFWVVVAMGAGSRAMLPALSSLELCSGCVRKRASLEPGPFCLSLFFFSISRSFSLRWHVLI